MTTPEKKGSILRSMQNVLNRIVCAGFCLFAVLAVSAAAGAGKESPEAVYQRAQLVETVERDLEAAIDLYRQAISAAGVDRRLSSKANLRMALCLERLERYDDAKRAYESALNLAAGTDSETEQSARLGLRRLKELEHQRERERLAQMYRSGALIEKTKSHLRLFASVDYFSPRRVDKDYESEIQDIVDDWDAGGFPSKAKITVDPGYGARFGFSVPVKNHAGLRFGSSIGYLIGPEVQGNIRTVANESLLSFRVTSRYIRLLADGSREIPFNKRLSFRGNLGAGIAHARVKSSAGSQSLLPTEDIEVFTDSQLGVSLELSAALMLDFERMKLEVGGRFATFPTVKGEDDAIPYRWNPFGLYAGVHF